MSKSLQGKILVKRYAKAFYQSLKNKEKNSIKSDLNNLRELFLSSFNAAQFKRLKVIEGKAQFIIMKVLLDKYSFDKTIYNFCLLLAKNKRLNLLTEIIEDLLLSLDLAEGIITAEVNTVKELDEEEISSIRSALSEKYGKDIKIKSVIDEKILGGLVITIDSKMFDDSLSTKFRKIEKLLSYI